MQSLVAESEGTKPPPQSSERAAATTSRKSDGLSQKHKSRPPGSIDAHSHWAPTGYTIISLSSGSRRFRSAGRSIPRCSISTRGLSGWTAAACGRTC